MESFSSSSYNGFLSKTRKVALIGDVDSLVPNDIKKPFSLIDEIVETNKETLSSVFKK